MTEAKSLAQLRTQIDAVDQALLTLLNRRAGLAHEVGEIKRVEGSPVYRPEREAQVILGLQGANPYSRRVRFITLQGLGSPLGQWQRETRDVAHDFAHVFADELPTGAGLPAVRAVLIGADSDNTGARSVGWVQSIQWLP